MDQQPIPKPYLDQLKNMQIIEALKFYARIMALAPQYSDSAWAVIDPRLESLSLAELTALYIKADLIIPKDEKPLSIVTQHSPTPGFFGVFATPILTKK